MPSTGTQKDINVIRKAVVANGFKVVPSGSGHWRVIDKKGSVVVDDNGPIILSSTASDHRARDMHVNRLLKAKVLKRDPWAPDKAKDRNGAEPPDDEDEQARAKRERELAEQKAVHQRHADRTKQVRERLEPIIVRLGGWEKSGLLKDTGQVAHYFANRMQLQNAWTSPEAARENADALRKGATLSESMAHLWEKLLDELEAWPDTMTRFFALRREAAGLDPPSIGEPDPVVVPQPDRSDDARIRLEPFSPEGGFVPQLAIELAFEIGVGRRDSEERHRLLALAERVARIEHELASSKQTEREEE